MRAIKINRFFSKVAGVYLLLVSCSVMGQDLQKRPITESDYHLWSDLIIGPLSDYGKWQAFKLKNTNGDTLFVKNTSSGLTYKFAGGASEGFAQERFFIYQSKNEAVVFDLENGTEVKRWEADFFLISSSAKYVVFVKRNGTSGNTVWVTESGGKEVAKYLNVSAYQWDTEKERFAVSYESEGFMRLDVLTLKEKFNRGSMPIHTGKISLLAWGENHLGILDAQTGRLCVYDLKNRKMISETAEELGLKDKLSSQSDHFAISSNGKKLFFATEGKRRETDPIVEVWGGDDKQIYPNRMLYGDAPNGPMVHVWFVGSQKVTAITDAQYPKATVGVDSPYALVWDPYQYEPQTDYNGPYDVVAVNLETGTRKLIVKALTNGDDGVFLDPLGRYVFYEKDYNWWSYDFKEDRHRNLTSGLGVPFERITFDRAGKKPQAGVAGFADGGLSLLARDMHDLWRLPADGSRAKRLTKFREQKVTARLVAILPKEKFSALGVFRRTPMFDLSRPVYGTKYDFEKGYWGYFVLKPDGKVQSLHWGASLTEMHAKAPKSETFSFISERFDSPRDLRIVKDGKISTLFESNPHSKYFQRGKSELIRYSVDGKPLLGVLIFPGDYNPAKKYPMVVSIYERQASELHKYVMPSMGNMTGFNPANLSAKGYFVLLPDIASRMREIGPSAKDCTLKAVDTALSLYSIDSKRIGLIGHSFGGYETDFIITQTDRFAAAVSGCALTDLVFSYLYVGGNYARPDFWRFEHDQQRMEQSLFENPQPYLDNSPVLQAAGVRTPLLSWTGKNDKHVNYLQSVEFYLALRRLGKVTTMLIYPDEQHVISNPVKQEDLTKRIEAWFEKYLKP